ncbi:hypothetical protein [Flavobacterium sp. 14A]|uniref:hypothetical protein n=1 Tax=Flavobacterium sp. 14A TaxID=2735896 RepID=UPI00156E5D6F|nr:hypothetical protein [Flavobacterium sp. 14A]NRT13664.1 hypothetical protein [Flavobacterium sp. 14A]
MNQDWNSFFSTISQSASAMIAIIGAFIISKLIGENEKKEILQGQIDDLKIIFDDVLLRISHRDFHWLDKKEIDKNDDLENSVKAGDFNRLSDDHKLKKLFEIIPNLYRTDACLPALKKLIIDLSSNNYGYNGDISRMLKPSPRINEENDKVKNLKVETYTLINKFKKTKNDCKVAKKNMTQIKNIIYLLIVGFFIAVIYPLHFMPLSENEKPIIEFSFNAFENSVFSFKGIFIIILSLVFVSIFGYFIYFINQIENSYDNFYNELSDKYLKLESYSPYFK